MRELNRREGMERLRRQGKTLAEIGKRYGVTRERVRQLVGHVVKDRDVGRAFDGVEVVIENPWGLGTLWCEGCGEILTYNAGHGLCVACYRRRRWRENPEYRRKHLEQVKSWQKRNPKKTREIERRANRGRCPVCDREYASIYSHLKRMHPPEHYRHLLDQVNEEKRRERKS